MSYLVYIVRCSDGTFYTGSTNDLPRRLAAHNEGKLGARYTRSRRPVALVYQEECGTVNNARSREAAIKQLSRAEKEDLIRAHGAVY